MNAGLKPKLADEGTSGSYEMRDPARRKIAIFKPIDEEPFAPNNPRGTTGPFGTQTLRKGVLSGEASIREVAAYLLDQGHFHKVPSTAFVEVIHPSLKYVPFSGMEVTSDDYKSILTSLIKPMEPAKATPESQFSTSSRTAKQEPFDEDGGLKATAEKQVGLKIGSF